MTYVMSDLHGMYDRFIAMLEKIDFSDSDELFIIGDIIDRGERPVDILEYVMDKPNITVLLGNHEVMARDFLRRLTAEITDGNTASFDNDFMVELAIYKHNGGIPTINRLLALPPDKQQSVLDFIDSLYAYEAIDIGDSTFVLVHAGLGNFRKDKKISEYSLYELLELRPDYERQYFDDDSIYIVSGHTMRTDRFFSISAIRKCSRCTRSRITVSKTKALSPRSAADTEAPPLPDRCRSRCAGCRPPSCGCRPSWPLQVSDRRS